MDARTHVGGEAAAHRTGVIEDRDAFGVRTPPSRGSGRRRRQMRVAVRRDVAGEAVDDARRVLQGIPARHLQDVALARQQRHVVLDQRPAPNAAVAGRPGDEPRVAQDHGALDRVELLVLGRERVDPNG